MRMFFGRRLRGPRRKKMYKSLQSFEIGFGDDFENVNDDENDEGKKGTNRCNVFKSHIFTQNRPPKASVLRAKMHQHIEKSINIAMKTHKSAQERERASQNTRKSLFLRFLARKKPLLGRPWAAPGRPERGQEHQNWSPKRIFHVFLNVIFHITFRIDFLSIFHRFLTLRNLKKHAPVEARARFPQNRRFRDEA